VLAQGKLPDGCRDSEAAAHLAAAPLSSRAISGALLVWSAEAAAQRQEIEMARLLRAVSDRGQTHEMTRGWCGSFFSIRKLSQEAKGMRRVVSHSPCLFGRVPTASLCQAFRSCWW